MPTTVREYLYAFLISATVVLLLASAVVFWGAFSLQAYVLAAGLLAVAGLAYLGASRLKPQRAAEDLEAFADYMGGKKVSNKEASRGN